MEIPVLKVAEAIAVCNELFSGLLMSVDGEVANYSLSRGKFVFFDLKDETEDARLSCFAMIHQLSIPLEDGMRVVVHSKPGLYQKNGQFRLSVLRVEPRGEGSVKRAFELLRLKLESEGLFSVERKRKLPRYVRKVAIISSEDAAGYGDFCKIALSRLPGVSYSLANVAVQGKDAESEICAAFNYLNSYHTFDVIVLIRGGGSMEDLHAFNSEQVARAIVRSKAPVLVGIGHERDSTIADFCADARASTPSNAAQILLPTSEEVLSKVASVTSEGRFIVEKAIDAQREYTKYRIERMTSLLLQKISQYRTSVETLVNTIETLAPSNILKRGYSFTKNTHGELITSVHSVQKGEYITTHVSDGTITSVV
jgi:exodeoxyribonuclease VII large subunit